jgi:hypothetical protein
MESRPEQELWAAFNSERPRVLGVLLDAVVRVAHPPQGMDFNDLLHRMNFVQPRFNKRSIYNLAWHPEMTPE